MKHTSTILLIVSLLSESVYLHMKADHVEITTLNDFQHAITTPQPTVILFYAPWCNACTTMKPIFKASAQKYGDKAQFIALDVTKDELKDAIDIFGIQGVPTLCYKEIGLKTSEQFNNRLTSFLGQPTHKTTSIKKPLQKPFKKPTRKPKIRTMPTKRTGNK